MTRERSFKPAYGIELLSVAMDDIKDAEKLFNSNPKRKENVFFLCQQSIEKALKAGLIILGEPVPLVHDLALLIDRYPSAYHLPISGEITELTEFATIRRYEGSIVEYDDGEIQAALDATYKLLKWIEKISKN